MTWTIGGRCRITLCDSRPSTRIRSKSGDSNKWKRPSKSHLRTTSRTTPSHPVRMLSTWSDRLVTGMYFKVFARYSSRDQTRRSGACGCMASPPPASPRSWNDSTKSLSVNGPRSPKVDWWSSPRRMKSVRLRSSSYLSSTWKTHWKVPSFQISFNSSKEMEQLCSPTCTRRSLKKVWRGGPRPSSSLRPTNSPTGVDPPRCTRCMSSSGCHSWPVSRWWSCSSPSSVTSSRMMRIH